MHQKLKHILTALCFLVCVGLSAENKTFYVLGQQHGLAGNSILQMTQLNDGRMLIVSKHSIDIYNGSRFEHIVRSDAHWQSLPGYHGATHLSVDSSDVLWLKDWQRLACYDLKRLRPVVPHLPAGTRDVWFDSQNNKWVVKGDTLYSGDSRLLLPCDAGVLQNIDVLDGRLFAFFERGVVTIYDVVSGRLLTQRDAYGDDDILRYGTTSTIQYSNGRFYQVRVGPRGQSIFLSFDSRTLEWTTLLRSSDYLHTLIITPTRQAYISTPDGYLHINLDTEQSEFRHSLRLPDGTIMHTGANTIFQDREGGIWLGTYSDGLLYSSPLSGVFDTQKQHIALTPVLTDFYLHGERVQPGSLYDGRELLSTQPPYAHRFVLSHHQNAIAFRFSSMNFVQPRGTIYRYRLSGQDTAWHTLSADSLQGLVNDQGVLYLPFVTLSPGNYRLEVMATTQPDVWQGATAVYDITVEAPWWQRPWAYVAYVLTIGLAVCCLTHLSLRRQRRRLEQQRREEQLMLRVQQLVEQVNQYEHSATMVVLNEPDQTAVEQTEPTAHEKEFMARATQLVEQHLTMHNYGVEQLAADLCMERTGLYKKLTAMMQQSPVAFIRSIRLHRAAELIVQGEQSITEIAKCTGFSSTSYFCKCFQREFGCKPSEYKPSPNSSLRKEI